jgi:hypothetical protein
MLRTSVSVTGVSLVLMGFAGCGSPERRFADATGGKSGATQGGNGGASGDSQGGRGGSAGPDADAGEAGVEIQAGTGGEAGTGNDAGEGGTAGESSVESALAIAPPNLNAGKTYAPFTGTIRASGGQRYTWSLSKGTLPSGLLLQSTQSASVTIAGTATEAGQFPLTLSVTDGLATKTVEVTLVITHPALFLSDRNVTGVKELFLTEVGGESAATPVRLSASFPMGGGVSSFAWSPDGSKVLYLATQSSTAAAELWVASVATPGNAQRVSAPGVAIGQFTWLGTGNIAAYSTNGGDTSLTDLSISPPSVGKLVVAGKVSAATLRPSPNGISVGIQLPATNANEMSSATWAGGTASAVSLVTAQGGGPYFSYDGRYSVITSGPSGYWFDHSIASPVGNPLSSSNGVTFAWHPSAETLFLATGSGPSFDLSRADFTSTGMTKTPLVSGSNCNSSQLRWSPDGKHGSYVCGADLRGINNLRAAVAGSDFSLLPSGFLSNTFTDLAATGWSPDSKWVALRADRDTNGYYDLQLIRWGAPGVAYKPHPTSIGVGVTMWAFAPTSQSIAFVGTVGPNADAALYVGTLPATGAPPTAALASAPASAVVQADVNWLPGARVIAYRAVVGNAAQLFAVTVGADGSAGSVVPISGASGSGVSSYQLAPVH